MVSTVSPALIFLDIDGVLSDYTTNESTRKKIKKTYRKIMDSERQYSLLPKDEAFNLVFRKATTHHFSKTAVLNLKSLIDRVTKERELFIVISSSWRNGVSLEDLQKHVFADHPGLARRIIGKTPDDDEALYERFGGIENIPSEIKTSSAISLEKHGLELNDLRGRQIEFWLKEHAAEWDIYSYAIIDDIDDGTTSEILERHLGRFVKVDTQQLLSEKNVDHACAALRVPITQRPYSSRLSTRTA